MRPSPIGRAWRLSTYGSTRRIPRSSHARSHRTVRESACPLEALPGLPLHRLRSSVVFGSGAAGGEGREGATIFAEDVPDIVLFGVGELPPDPVAGTHIAGHSREPPEALILHGPVPYGAQIRSELTGANEGVTPGRDQVYTARPTASSAMSSIGYCGRSAGAATGSISGPTQPSEWVDRLHAGLQTRSIGGHALGELLADLIMRRQHLPAQTHHQQQRWTAPRSYFGVLPERREAARPHTEPGRRVGLSRILRRHPRLELLP